MPSSASDGYESIYNTFQRASKRSACIGFAIGVGFAGVFPFLDRVVGQWPSVAGAALMIIQVVFSNLMLRLDMVRTYEFWYLAVVCVSTHVLVGFCLRDAHIALIVCFMLMYQYVQFIDANYRGAKITVVASAVGGIFIFLFIVVHGFHRMKDYNEWDLVGYDAPQCVGRRHQRYVDHLARDPVQRVSKAPGDASPAP